MHKLIEKNQPEDQRQRAAHAVSLYFEMPMHEDTGGRQKPPPAQRPGAQASDGEIAAVPVPHGTEPDTGLLTINGKGAKDRTVPLPRSIIEELQAQIKVVGELHGRDLAAGYL